LLAAGNRMDKQGNARACRFVASFSHLTLN
jgi:hypothetical protein